jgi:hypothetical protein
VSLSSASTQQSVHDKEAAPQRNDNAENNEEERDEQHRRRRDGDLDNLINLLDDSSDMERVVHDDGENDTRIVDLTQSPQRSHVTSSTVMRTVSQTSSSSNDKSSNVGLVDQERYKRIAKRYKRKAQKLESKQKEQHEEGVKLLSVHKELQSTVRELQKELQGQDELNHSHELEVNRLNLKVVRLEFERDNLKGRVQALSKEVQYSSQKLKQHEVEKGNLQLQHQKQLEKARQSTLVETQQIMAIYPKLEAECHCLKEQVNELQQKLANHRRATSTSASSSRIGIAQHKKSGGGGVGGNKSSHRSKLGNLAKSLRLMESAQHPTFSEHHPNPLTTSAARATINDSNNTTTTKGPSYSSSSSSTVGDKVNFGHYSGRAALLSAAATHTKKLSISNNSTESSATDWLGPRDKASAKNIPKHLAALRDSSSGEKHAKENQDNRAAVVGLAGRSYPTKRPATSTVVVAGPPLPRTGLSVGEHHPARTSLSDNKRSRTAPR